MHKYLRSIGFSQYVKKKDIDKLLSAVAAAPAMEERLVTPDATFVHYCKDFSPVFGLYVGGEKDEKGRFEREYYFPYLLGENLTAQEGCSIMRLSDKEAYAAFCEELGLGISMIFFLQNPMDYMRLQYGKAPDTEGRSIILTGLSAEGKVLLPVQKTQEQICSIRAASKHRNKLIEAARKGDEEAMEDLTLEDINIYTELSRRILFEDIYSIVDSTFMPSGVECDHYTVVGEILEVDMVKNQLTGEDVVVMLLESYDLQFRIAINRLDLFGEPLPGRRFKGEIWMQGQVEFRA